EDRPVLVGTPVRRRDREQRAEMRRGLVLGEELEQDRAAERVTDRDLDAARELALDRRFPGLVRGLVGLRHPRRVHVEAIGERAAEVGGERAAAEAAVLHAGAVHEQDARLGHAHDSSSAPQIGIAERCLIGSDFRMPSMRAATSQIDSVGRSASRNTCVRATVRASKNQYMLASGDSQTCGAVAPNSPRIARLTTRWTWLCFCSAWPANTASTARRHASQARVPGTRALAPGSA